VGILVSADPAQAAVSQSAADAFGRGLGVPAVTLSAARPLDAVAALVAAGVHLIVVPVWPDGLDPTALDAMLAPTDIRVLSASSQSASRVISLRPAPEVEAEVMAGH